MYVIRCSVAPYDIDSEIFVAIVYIVTVWSLQSYHYISLYWVSKYSFTVLVVILFSNTIDTYSAMDSTIQTCLFLFQLTVALPSRYAHLSRSSLPVSWQCTPLSHWDHLLSTKNQVTFRYLNIFCIMVIGWFGVTTGNTAYCILSS